MAAHWCHLPCQCLEKEKGRDGMRGKERVRKTEKRVRKTESEKREGKKKGKKKERKRKKEKKRKGRIMGSEESESYNRLTE